MTEKTKVIAVPTVTKLDQSAHGSVVVGGSHGAVFTTYLTLAARALSAIHHDACIGRNEAGVSGLEWAEQFGFAMAAVDGHTARIGDGEDMMRRGRISRVNRQAAACGVEQGMDCAAAADLLRKAAPASFWPEQMTETRQKVELTGELVIDAMDSVALAREHDRGKIISTGSHGGKPSAGYAGKIAPRLVLFNDAGFGPEDAGIASFASLDEAGIAAAAVSAFSAEIGNGRSTLLDGVLSAANRRAIAMGARIGRPSVDLVIAAAG